MKSGKSPRPNAVRRKSDEAIFGLGKRFRKIVIILILIVVACLSIALMRPDGLHSEKSPSVRKSGAIPKAKVTLSESRHEKSSDEESNEGEPDSLQVQKIKAWWAFTFVTIIIIFSVSFENAVEYVRHAVPEELKEVIGALLEELTTLGFLGFAFFLTTLRVNEEPSLIESLSLYSLHERGALAELFEGLHYLVFTISLSYIFCTLGGMYEFQYGEGGSVSWKRYDEAGKNAANAAEYVALLQVGSLRRRRVVFADQGTLH